MTTPHPLSLFVVQQATKLAVARQITLTEAVGEVIGELGALDDYFDPTCGCFDDDSGPQTLN